MDLYLVFLGLALPSLMRFASGREMCPYPSDSNFTGLTAKKYLVGTKLVYECDPEHFAGVMDIFFYTCKNSNGVNKWISKHCYCHKHDRITTNTEIGNKSSDCEVPTNVNETLPGDYCGPPPSVKNAKLDFSQSNFPIGHEFHYRLQCGVLKCNPSGAWDHLLDGCISNLNKSSGKSSGSLPTEATICTNLNKSSGKSSGSLPTEATICTNINGSSGKCNGSLPAEEKKCTTGVHATCIGVAVGGIITAVVLFAIFKIAQWRIKSTGNVKCLERNNVSAHEEEEMATARVPLDTKQQTQCGV